VTRLILGLNNLGDLGCIHLFAFLRSEEGKKFDRITELSLNSNNIGDVGLLALSEWLRDHVTIQEMFLQNVRVPRRSVTQMNAADSSLRTPSPLPPPN
jgi:hypothetical protein